MNFLDIFNLEKSENKKSFLKHTILGLLSGTALASAYSLISDSDDEEKELDKNRDKIIIPLSKKNLLKSVRSSRLNNLDTASRKQIPVKPIKQDIPPKELPDLSKMTPLELSNYKKSLLRGRLGFKAASAPESITRATGTVTSTAKIDRKGGSSFKLRDTKGRYATDALKETEKKAFAWSDIPLVPSLDNIKAENAENIGLIGGTAAGILVTKLILDKIRNSRKKKEVEEAQRLYAAKIKGNIDKAAEVDKLAERNIVERTLGGGTTLGLGIGAIAALVTYRLMENRRKKLESEADQESTKFPKNKTVEFKLV